MSIKPISTRKKASRLYLSNLFRLKGIEINLLHIARSLKLQTLNIEVLMTYLKEQNEIKAEEKGVIINKKS